LGKYGYSRVFSANTALMNIVYNIYRVIFNNNKAGKYSTGIFIDTGTITTMNEKLSAGFFN
jgi:hypothetical protein